MPRSIQLSNTAAGVEVSLFASISTPTWRNADTIDPAYPTILFCHPVWLDSFFFYPQFDDPLLRAHFNLVAFDMRGHGATVVKGRDDTFDMLTQVDDCRDGLQALGVSRAHLVGCGSGANVVSLFLNRYPDMALSGTMISILPQSDSELVRSGYRECHDAMIQAVKTGDYDLLDTLTTATFEFSAGAPLTPALHDLRDEYKLLNRSRFTTDNVDDAAHYIWTPVIERAVIDITSADNAPCPKLVLKTLESDHGVEHMIDALEDLPAVTLKVVEGVPQWMSLTTPNLINPILSKFLASPVSADLPEIPESPISPISIARRPSTPREVTFFSIPPPMKLPPGMMTIGDALVAEAKAKGRKGSINPNVVHVEIEIVVDEAH